MTFIDILEQFNIEYREHGQHEHTTSGWVNIDCPFCSKGWEHYRLGFNINYGYMSCWSCGPKKMVNVLTEITGQQRSVIYALVKDLDKSEIPEEFSVRGKLVYPKYVGILNNSHHKYLKSRGLDPYTMSQLWKVQGIGVSPTHAWRLFIPIYYKGEVVSWTTRSIKPDAKLRYKAAEAKCEKINHHHLLYGEDYARNTIIVCEGPVDVWKIGPGSVCTCGLAYSRQQVARIARYPTRYICFDSEPEAQAKANKLANDLSVLDGNTFNVVLDSGKDPGSADKKELEQLRRLLA